MKKEGVFHMDVRQMRNEALGKRVVKALESRNMEAYYASTKEEAVQKALELIEEGSKITMGGSMSVREVGLLDAINEGDYEFYDRDKASTVEERQEIALKAFTCDWYLGSVNAMSEDGVFVNIDGNANRVAAYAFGPKNVLLIVGMNKVVKSEEDAMHRARNEAAPINIQRFGLETPCVKNGTCFDCKSSDCICCQVLVTRFSRIPKRFKIILVDDVLGF
jgi:L-lactate utilization protein LutB